MEYFQLLLLKTRTLLPEKQKVNKSRKKRMFASGLILLLSFFLTSESYSAGVASPCSHLREIMRDIAEGDLKNAYNLSVQCENYFNARLDESFSSDLLRAQYFITSQIISLDGKDKEGNDLSADARWNMAAALPGTDLFLWLQWEDGAKGLLLERAGHMREAENLYKNMGAFGLGRLAVLYLMESKEQEAKETANKVLTMEPDNPTATIVLAALLEKDDPRTAFGNYEKALLKLRKVYSGDNWTAVPLYYAEGPRAKFAIQRVRSALGLPPE